jgi:NTP pyrophosphatase (non-canonical NTP hydrolase)
MKISEAQKVIAETYGKKDRERGAAGTFMYLIEEVGELATAIREEGQQEKASEFADVFAWTLSLAALEGIDLEQAFLEKYSICNGCGKSPCECATKP